LTADETFRRFDSAQIARHMRGLKLRGVLSCALEASEGRYINKEGVKKTEKILSFYVITSRQPSTLERDLPNYKLELERRFNQEKILITYHDVTEVS
jgi:hypothetical protein